MDQPGMENSTQPALTPAHKGIFISIWLLAVEFNFLSVIVMGRTMCVKKIWPNIFVVALNANDMSCLVGGLLPTVIATFSNQLLMRFLRLCQYQAFFLNVTYLSSMALVVCISLDRYAAVGHPFYYNRRIAKGGGAKFVSALLILVAFIIMAISAMPLALGVRYTIVGPGMYCFFDWDQRLPRGRAVALANLSLGSLLIAMVLYLTIRVCAHLYSMVKDRDVDTYNPCLQESYFLKLSVVIGITFSACSLPLLITIAVHQGISYGDTDVSYIVLSVQFLSSAINPMLYAAARPATRRGYIEVFRWVFYFLTCCWKWARPSKPFDEVIGVAKRSAVVASDAAARASDRTAQIQMKSIKTPAEQQSKAMCLQKITV